MPQLRLLPATPGLVDHSVVAPVERDRLDLHHQRGQRHFGRATQGCDLSLMKAKALLPLAAGAALAGSAFLESLRQRARAAEAEACLQLYALSELDEGLYQVCPDCHGDCGGCSTCFDAGVLPHICGEGCE